MANLPEQVEENKATQVDRESAGIGEACWEKANFPDTRPGITHKFSVNGTEGYLTVTVDDDGNPRQLFLKVAKEGSTLGGLMDGVGILASKCFKYKVPLNELIEVMSHTRFEPAGHTSNPELKEASSLLDYVFRWMGQRFGSSEGEASVANQNPQE